MKTLNENVSDIKKRIIMQMSTEKRLYWQNNNSTDWSNAILNTEKGN